jgi:hypothetical protein
MLLFDIVRINFELSPHNIGYKVFALTFQNLSLSLLPVQLVTVGPISESSSVVIHNSESSVILTDTESSVGPGCGRDTISEYTFEESSVSHHFNN